MEEIVNRVQRTVGQVGRMARKSGSVGGAIFRNPELIALIWKGVHPEIYDRLSAEWLKRQGFNTVLDIGANNGQFSEVALHLFSDAQVIACEPHPGCIRKLESLSSKYPALSVIPAAIGAEDGEIEFFENQYSQSSSALPMEDSHIRAFPHTRQVKNIKVRIRTLDSLNNEVDILAPALLKVDVQGYEDRVIAGASSVLEKVAVAIIETAFEPLYSGEAKFERISAMMRDRGFELRGILNQTCDPISGIPLYADAIFVQETKIESDSTYAS